MNKDQAIGAVILVASVAGLAAYMGAVRICDRCSGDYGVHSSRRHSSHIGLDRMDYGNDARHRSSLKQQQRKLGLPQVSTRNPHKKMLRRILQASNDLQTRDSSLDRMDDGYNSAPSPLEAEVPSASGSTETQEKTSSEEVRPSASTVPP